MYCEVSYTRSKLYNTTKNLCLLKLLVIFLPPQKRSALKTLLKEDMFEKEEVKVWIVFLFFFTYTHLCSMRSPSKNFQKFSRKLPILVIILLLLMRKTTLQFLVRRSSVFSQTWLPTQSAVNILFYERLQLKTNFYILIRACFCMLLAEQLRGQ